MHSWIRNIKIQYRLLAVFLLISLLPTVCIGTYAYHVYTRSINNKISDSVLQTMRSINTNMTIELEKYQDYCSTLSIADAVQDSLRQTLNGQAVSREMVLAIRELATAIPLQSTYLKNLRIVSLDGTTIYDRGYDDIPYEKSEQLVETIDEASPKDSLQYIYTYRSQNKLVLGRKLYSVDFSGEAVGYIMVYINEQLFEEKIFAGVTFGPSSNIMLVNAHGDVLSSQDRSFLGENIADSRLFQEVRTNTTAGQNTFNLEHQIAVAVYNKDFDCYLIADIPESYITEETRSINTVLFWIAAALIFLSLLLTFVVYVSIVSPIRNIIAACNIKSDEELNVHINDQNQDELGFLARTIDRMMDEILLLMARRKEDQIRRRELELKNLQYQINPHFLYNTLDSIAWMCEQGRNADAVKMVHALARLFRISISQGNELIPVAREIEHAESYLQIQKYRYKNQFTYAFDVDPECLDFLCNKITLQPIIENAINHGLKLLVDEGRIDVRVYRDGEDVVFSVQDNGVGMTPEQVESILRRDPGNHTGIGIKNVNDRLQIYFGKQYGLHITSEPDVGTTVEIRMPQIREGDYETK